MGRAMLTRWATALTAVTLLYACARESEPKNYRVAHQPIKNSGEADEADLVSAVSPGGSESPVGLKFKVSDPPKVGQTAHLELVLAQDPGLDISHLLVSLQPGDGLLIESDRSYRNSSAPAGGDPPNEGQLAGPAARPAQPECHGPGRCGKHLPDAQFLDPADRRALSPARAGF